MLSKSMYFKNKVLALGQLSDLLKKVLNPYANDPEAIKFTIHETLPDGTRSSQFEKNYNNLTILYDTSKQSIETRFMGKEKSYIGFAIRGNDSYFNIEISSENPSES